MYLCLARLPLQLPGLYLVKWVAKVYNDETTVMYAVGRARYPGSADEQEVKNLIFHLQTSYDYLLPSIGRGLLALLCFQTPLQTSLSFTAKRLW